MSKDSVAIKMTKECENCGSNMLPHDYYKFTVPRVWYTLQCPDCKSSHTYKVDLDSHEEKLVFMSLLETAGYSENVIPF